MKSHKYSSQATMIVMSLILMGQLAAAQESALVSFITPPLIRVQEYEPDAEVQLRRTGRIDSEALVHVSSAALSAVPGQDYADIDQDILFGVGQTDALIRVPLINDGVAEASESFRLILSDPGEAVMLGSPNVMTVTILDNDLTDEPGGLPVRVGGWADSDWGVQGVRWRQGYPKVDVTFDSDESIRFPVSQGGSQRQGISDFTIACGSAYDNPQFTSTYAGDLHPNWLIADAGEVTLTYDLEFPTQLFDLLIADVDEEDLVRIEARGFDGLPIAPSEWQIVLEGDLSLYKNSPGNGRPAAELATPPIWDPAAGTLTAAITWNENRSLTVMRPKIPVIQVSITFIGTHPAAGGPETVGSHIYAMFWATPQPLEILEMTPASTEGLRVRWASLPGVPYHILSSSDFSNWVDEGEVLGATAPAVTTETLLATDAVEPVKFFRIQRW